MHDGTTWAVRIGENLGPYRIEGLLGAGGMGRVYLARDNELRRTVAIKVVDHTKKDPQSIRSLLREARLADDKTPGVDVVLDALERVPGYDWVVLLQPTSPLRAAADVDEAIRRCARLEAPKRPSTQSKHFSTLRT